MITIPKFIKGLDPVADAFAGTATTDVVSMRNYKQATFVVHKGVSTGGTDNGVVTVEACDDVTPSNTTAVEFHYQEILTGDTPSEIKSAGSTGFAMTAGSSQLYAVYVNASVLAATGYGYLRLKVTEDTDDPVVASVAIMLTESKDEREVPETVIV